MKSALTTLAALGILAALPVAANAHFIWATVENHQARFALLENVSESPDARFERYVSKLAPSCGGRPISDATLKDGARYVSLPNGQSVVVADSVVGAKEREGVPYLLVYHAKGADSLAAAGTAAKDADEILARRDGKSLVVTVLQNDKAAVKSDVYVKWPGDEEESPVTTDSKGEVRLPWPEKVRIAGFVGVRAMVPEAKSGELDGKKYTVIHNWTTLTFPIDGPKPDLAAWNLLKEAHDSRQTFGATFPGLTADVYLNDNGVERTGKLSYTKLDGVELTLDGAATPTEKKWTEGIFANLLGHRRGGDFTQGDGANPITFAEDDRSPIGRKVVLHDGFQSEYRVKDHTVTEVTRTMDNTRFTITMLEFDKEDGKFLPRHFAVTYFDAKTGAIQKVEDYTDRHEKVDGIWMPVSRRVIEAKDGKFTTRIVELRNAHLTPATGSSVAQANR